LNRIEFEKEFLRKMDQIIDRLDLLLRISLPSSKAEGIKLGGLEQAVFQLCDLRHTRKEIANELKKSTNLIDVTLNGLKKKGLIAAVEIEGNARYMRLGQ